MNEEINEEPSGPHTWSQAFENVGCGLILAVFFLAMVGICAWGFVVVGRR